MIFETTRKLEIPCQPNSKGKYVTYIDGNEVGLNLHHVSYLLIEFQSRDDLIKFKRGLEPMGKPGMLAVAQARSMYMHQRLDEKAAIDRKKALEAQSNPLKRLCQGRYT